jgi:hypothetical protein
MFRRKVGANLAGFCCEMFASASLRDALAAAIRLPSHPAESDDVVFCLNFVVSQPSQT